MTNQQHISEARKYLGETIQVTFHEGTIQHIPLTYITDNNGVFRVVVKFLKQDGEWIPLEVNSN